MSSLTETEYQEAYRNIWRGSFTAKMGAEAIRDLLEHVDVDKVSEEIKK